MIRIAENDLRAHLIELPRVERLHAGECAYWHIYRRFHDAMGRMQFSQARFGLRIRFEKVEHWRENKRKIPYLKMKFSNNRRICISLPVSYSAHMKSERTKDSPDVISCPPMVFFWALAAGLLLNWLIRSPQFPSAPL